MKLILRNYIDFNINCKEKSSQLPTLFSSTNVYTVNIYRVHDRGKVNGTRKAISIQILQSNYLQFTPVT
jgi:hypothetical protein